MDNLEGIKSAVQSVGVWGGVIAVLAGIGGLFGYSVSAADQATLSQAVASAGATVGGLVSIWGRIRASRKIG